MCLIIGDVRQYILAEGIQLAIGVHLYRAGRLLVEGGVPYIMILGGTDINEYSKVEARVKGASSSRDSHTLQQSGDSHGSHY